VEDSTEVIDKKKYINFIFDYANKETDKENIEISKSTRQSIINIIEETYGINNSENLFTINIVYNINENEYLVHGILKYSIIIDDYKTADGISIKEKLSKCKYSINDSKSTLPCSDQHFWSVVDISIGSFKRIPETIRFTEGSPKIDFAYIPLGVTYNSLVYYGCYATYRFGKVDLDLDGKYELVIFSGTGSEDFGMSQAPEHADASLYFSIYSLSDTRKPLFHHHLVTNNMDYTQRKGSREYTKFYFKDYNENGKLDIISWTRKFNVSYVNKVGFKETFISDNFRVFEEASPSFVEKKLTKDKISEIVTTQGLRWEEGFPSKNICKTPPFNTFDILPNGKISQ